MTAFFWQWTSHHIHVNFLQSLSTPQPTMPESSCCLPSGSFSGCECDFLHHVGGSHLTVFLAPGKEEGQAIYYQKKRKK